MNLDAVTLQVLHDPSELGREQVGIRPANRKGRLALSSSFGTDRKLVTFSYASQPLCLADSRHSKVPQTSVLLAMT